MSVSKRSKCYIAVSYSILAIAIGGIFAISSGSSVEKSEGETEKGDQVSEILPDDTAISEEGNDVSEDQEISLAEEELDNIDALMNEGKYEEALRAALDAKESFSDNAELDSMYNAAAAAYEKDTNDQVQMLLAVNNPDGARTKVNEASALLPDSILIQSLSEQVMKYYPVKLSSVSLIDEGSCIDEVEENVRDLRGNTYEWGIVYDAGNDMPDPAYQVYMLNREYRKFSGTIAAREESSSDTDILFEIYARDENRDEEELYSCVASSVGQPIPFEIDVTGVDQLVIRFTFGEYLNSRYILAEPELMMEIPD